MVNIGSSLISNLGNISSTLAAKPASVETTGTTGFKDVLSEALQKFDSIGDENAQTTLELMTGNTDDLSNVMITAQKAEIAVELTVAIRNKAMDAYKEIMNMQV